MARKIVKRGRSKYDKGINRISNFNLKIVRELTNDNKKIWQLKDKFGRVWFESSRKVDVEKRKSMILKH